MPLRSTQRRFLIGLIALLAGCTLNSAPSNQPVSGEPVVRIVSPQPNATYLEGVAVNIQATVSNAGADIDRVEIVVDGSTVATVPSPNADGATMFNATYGWSAAGVGTHTLGVTAYRSDGTSSAPASVEITVIAANGTQSAGSPNASGATRAVRPRPARPRRPERLISNPADSRQRSRLRRQRPARRRRRRRPPARPPVSSRGSTSGADPVSNSIRPSALLPPGRRPRSWRSTRQDRGTRCATAAARAGFSPR